MKCCLACHPNQSKQPSTPVIAGARWGRPISLPTGALLALLLTCAPAGLAREPGFDLGEYWPLDAPARTWNLICVADLGASEPVIRMTVQNETVRPGEFILWFSNKKGQPADKRDGECFRLCKTGGRAWLYLDAYIDAFAGRPPIRHDVVSDRILFSPAGGAPEDLIENGTHRACGSIGQPYLLWSDAPASYRIQVWGHLTEHAKFRWYWDATVTKGAQVVNDGLTPGRKTSAVRVEEAWWSSFSVSTGSWAMGSGSMDPVKGVPSGNDVAHGRAVWHGAGQIPYLMIKASNAPPGATWCVNAIAPAR